VTLFNPGAVRTTRYRYRGAAIPSPWARTAACTSVLTNMDLGRAGCVETRQVRFGGRVEETDRSRPNLRD
jgi:hypothetical protein